MSHNSWLNDYCTTSIVCQTNVGAGKRFVEQMKKEKKSENAAT